MHGLVQGHLASDIVAGDGVEMALGQEAIARRGHLGDGDAGALANFGDAAGLHLADDFLGPDGKILGHVAFENASERPAPIGGDQLLFRLQFLEQFIGFFGRQIGVEPEMGRRKVPDDGSIAIARHSAASLGEGRRNGNREPTARRRRWTLGCHA